MDEIQGDIKCLPERLHLLLAHVSALYLGFFCNGKIRLQLPANLMVLRKAPAQGDAQSCGTTVLCGVGEIMLRDGVGTQHGQKRSFAGEGGRK